MATMSRRAPLVDDIKHERQAARAEIVADAHKRCERLQCGGLRRAGRGLKRAAAVAERKRHGAERLQSLNKLGLEPLLQAGAAHCQLTAWTLGSASTLPEPAAPAANQIYCLYCTTNGGQT
jgi:hypothetical protein